MQDPKITKADLIGDTEWERAVSLELDLIRFRVIDLLQAAYIGLAIGLVLIALILWRVW